MGIGGAAVYGLALLVLRKLEQLGVLVTPLSWVRWVSACQGRGGAARAAPLRATRRAMPPLE
jgi:drug/metabolite transporter (DMT)-like permease